MFLLFFRRRALPVPDEPSGRSGQAARLAPCLEGFDQPCDFLSGRSLQSRDDVLGRRLQQSDDIADKLLAGLDVDQFLEGALAQIYALLYVSGLQHRLRIRLAELFDQLRRPLARIAEHDGRLALERRHQLRLGLLDLLERLDEKRILDDYQLYLLLEAHLPQSGRLLGIQLGGIGDIEMRIFLQFLGQTVDNDLLFFPVHLFSII